MPVPTSKVVAIELALLWSLVDARAGKPSDDWLPELLAGALVCRALVGLGIGDADITAVAERALAALTADPVQDLVALQDLVACVPQQIRLCNVRQLGMAQDRAAAAVATTPPPPP